MRSVFKFDVDEFKLVLALDDANDDRTIHHGTNYIVNSIL